MAGLEEREGHGEPTTGGCLDALREYTRRWERGSIESDLLPGGAIPPDFAAGRVGEGYLLSWKLQVDGRFTYHFFAPSTSIPKITLQSDESFHFNPRTGLAVVVKADTDVAACVNLTRRCSTIHSQCKTRPVNVEVSHIPTSDSSWPSPFQSYELKPCWDGFRSICLTSRRIAIVAFLDGGERNISVWDREGKLCFVSLLICLLNVKRKSRNYCRKTPRVPQRVLVSSTSTDSLAQSPRRVNGTNSTWRYGIPRTSIPSPHPSGSKSNSLRQNLPALISIVSQTMSYLSMGTYRGV